MSFPGSGGLMGFVIVFTNVFLMLIYLLCGFSLVKSGKAESGHAKSVSGLLIYVCGPCMILNAFQSMEHSAENFGKMAVFFLVTLLLQLVFVGILYAVLHRRYDNPQYRILTAGAVLANGGFFGLPVITALFPNEPIVACYSTLYITGMNLLVFTVGVFLITRDKKYISPRAALLNPTTLAAIASLLLALCDIRLPETAANAVSLLGKMTTPLCMVVLGMRLASANLKKIFTRSFAYADSLLKLIVFPIFCYLCVCFLPCFDEVFKISVLVLSACPSAAIILSLAELHGCEQELSANVVLLSTLLSLFTLPLLLLIV